MNHHEQHHQHHQHEREKRIEQDKLRERESDRSPRKIHPAWFLALGTVLVGLVVLIWMFL
jgi:type VI protein secretion system component VasF